MSTRFAGKLWLVLVLALLATGVIWWIAGFTAPSQKGTVTAPTKQVVSQNQAPAGPITVPCPDGKLVTITELRPTLAMESFYIDLLGTGTPQKVALHTIGSGETMVDGYKLVISQGQKTLASFTLTGQFGEVYVASLREQNQPELVVVLYGGNAVVINDFKIIGNDGEGRIAALMNAEEMDLAGTSNTWDVNGKNLVTEFLTGYPNYTGPNADSPHLGYRGSIRWNKGQNKFETSEATPTWSVEEEYRKMSQEAFSHAKGLALRREEFPDKTVTRALFLDYGASQPQGFLLDLDGSGKLAQVIAIPYEDYGYSVYVLQEEALPVYLRLGGESLTCYAVHLRDGKTTELVFLTEQGTKGELWDFIVVGVDGQRELAILSRGYEITNNVTGSSLEARGRKLVFHYQIHTSPDASGLSLRPMIEEQQEIWWDQEAKKIRISRPH